MDVTAEDVMPSAFVLNDVLFHRNSLYEVAKPAIVAMKSMMRDAIATSVGASRIFDLNLRWGKERMSQFVEPLPSGDFASDLISPHHIQISCRMVIIYE